MDLAALSLPCINLTPMLPDVYQIAAGIVGLLVAACFGTLVGFQTGRRSIGNSPGESRGRRHSSQGDRVRRELRQCLDIAECVVRDADTLSAAAMKPTRGSWREPEAELLQLRKTVKALAVRLQQFCDENEHVLDELAYRPNVQSASTPAAPPERLPAPTAAATPAPCAAETTVGPSGDAPDSEPRIEQRKYLRQPCPGTIKATIYPPPHNPGAEPVQCTIVTRDLSCGGIGVAHFAPLYPQQIIVLNAANRLLVGEVRWCQQIGERSFIAGCQLVKTSS
jgi:hypothetical protein